MNPDDIKEPQSSSQIYLDIEDDITGIIGKIEGAAKDEVALVVPKRSTVMQSAVNMKLLKKSARMGHKKLVLITDDPVVNKIAGRLDVLTAASLKDEPKVPEVENAGTADLPSDVIESDAPITPTVSSPTPVTPPAATESPAKEPGSSPAQAAMASAAATAGKAKDAIKKRVPDFGRFKKRLLLGLGGVIGLVALIWLMFFSLPRATVLIDAQTEPLGAAFDFTADTQAKNADYNNDVLPAVSHSIDKTLSKTFTPTGKKDLGKKAGGTVEIENCETDDTISYSAGTRFTSDGGKVFTANSGFSVPGATVSGGLVCGQSDNVAVTAIENGTSYNIAATTYTSPNFAGAYTITGSKMEGGETKIATVPSKKDIESAQKELLTEERSKSKATLTEQFEEDEYRIEASYEEDVTESKSEPGVDQEATGDATLTLKVTYKQLAVKKGEIVELFKRNAAEEANKQNKANLGVVEEGLEEAKITLRNKPSKTASRFTAATTAHLGPNIDFEQLKVQLGGKKFSDAVQTVQGFQGVTGVDVKFSPFWVRRVPRDPAKVTIDIKLPQ